MKPIAALLAAVVMATPVLGQEWAWLKLDKGPAGEATDEHHREWMVIDGFGLEGELIRGEPGAFSLVKKIDRASPHLFLACVSGALFAEATVDIARQASDDGLPDVFARLELKNVRILAVETEGSGDSATERIDLAFEEIRYSYFHPGTLQGQGLFAMVNFETSATGQGTIGDGGNPDPPPVWFTATLARLAGDPDTLRLTWPSVPGQEYRVEWSPDLRTKFVPLRTLTADGESTHIDFPIDGRMGFFRVARP